MRRTMEGLAEYVQGSVRAVVAGSRAFQERLEPRRALDPGSRSNLLGALVSGAARYMESMAQVVGTAAQRLREADAPEAHGAPGPDHER
jgi:hypothetical protein